MTRQEALSLATEWLEKAQKQQDRSLRESASFATMARAAAAVAAELPDVAEVEPVDWSCKACGAAHRKDRQGWPRRCGLCGWTQRHKDEEPPRGNWTCCGFHMAACSQCAHTKLHKFRRDLRLNEEWCAVCGCQKVFRGHLHVDENGGLPT